MSNSRPTFSRKSSMKLRRKHIPTLTKWPIQLVRKKKHRLLHCKSDRP
jgi:hypothetical protein